MKDKKTNGKPENETSKDSLILELADYKEHLQRLQAEFDNYRKRIEKEREEYCKFANHELMLKLLSILDSFELALKSTDKKEDFIQGIEMIYSQFYSVLEKEGLKKIDALNKKFDPNYHEVLLIENSENEDGVILEELQRGYLLNDKVIRHTKVKINKGANVHKNE